MGESGRNASIHPLNTLWVLGTSIQIQLFSLHIGSVEALKPNSETNSKLDAYYLTKLFFVQLFYGVVNLNSVWQVIYINGPAPGSLPPAVL